MESIIYLKEKIKIWIGEGRGALESRDLYVVVLIILISAMSYGLGRLSKIQENRVPVQIENPGQVLGSSISNTANIGSLEQDDSSGKYVGSINSDKYHLPWCSGATRISDGNKVWFASKADAQAQGYVPAGNCPGL